MNEVVTIEPSVARIFVPQQGTLISLEAMEQSERQIAAIVETIDNIAELEDIRDKFNAIAEYVKKKQLHLPALGAQRRLEARIGQLLGEAQVGKPNPHRDEVSNDQTRSDFRLLARALSGEVVLTPDEWRQSRRQLVQLVKDRIPKEEDMAVVETETKEPSAYAGARINVPEGKTAEEIVRAGLVMEEAGLIAEDIAKEFNIGVNSYRKMRDVVLLADRGGFSKKDGAAVKSALQEMNQTNQISEVSARIAPIAEKVWGGTRSSSPKGEVEAKRIERFEHAFGIIMQSCMSASDMELPYLSAERASAAIEEIKEAQSSLRELAKRIQEIHG